MNFRSLLLIAAAAVLSACSYAPANVQTLMTTDCGVNWTVIKPGQRVPSGTGNPCAYDTTLPNYAMQGDTEFKAPFDQGVLVTVRISYDYEIIDPLKYINEAKFLGKKTSDGQANSGIEMAENSVIDKRLRESTTSLTTNQNIVEFNTAKFELELEKKTNVDLVERGVRINSMTFVMITEDQTRMAIDAATAINVYKSKGLEEFGKQMAVARAGATNITVNTTTGK